MMLNSMKVGLLAPPWAAIPPPGYGGTESVVCQLARGLTAAEGSAPVRCCRQWHTRDRGSGVAAQACGEHDVGQLHLAVADAAPVRSFPIGYCRFAFKSFPLPEHGWT
jgi:hypothetical protein